MRKPKSTKPLFKVKTGNINDFFQDVKSIMHSADKGNPVAPDYTLTFENPAEMLHFLSDAKIKLIDNIRHHPDSITNIAKTAKRNRAAVYRDVQALEKFGLVKTHQEINPGHGRYKIVELVARTLKLEAYI